jgi:GT2 family glycosyltransferase
VISVVIPHWPMPHTDAALERCAYSLEGHGELIVVVNEGIGFGPAVNQGLRLARGRYLCVVNNDTVLCEGSLEHLCVPGSVTVPCIHGQPDWLPRAFYCMDREVYDLVGGYDEQYRLGYFEDDDMILRWREAGISIQAIQEVVVNHQDGGGMTMKSTGLERELMEENGKRFLDKWGELAYDKQYRRTGVRSQVH